MYRFDSYRCPMGSDFKLFLTFPIYFCKFLKELENMSNLSVSEKNRLGDREIDKKVNNMFRRAHKIKRIRRNRKIKEWLKSCF